jgi:hypothetical protein
MAEGIPSRTTGLEVRTCWQEDVRREKNTCLQYHDKVVTLSDWYGIWGAVVARSVQCLTTDWKTGRSGFNPRRRKKEFSCSLCVQNSSEAHPASYPIGTGGRFPGGKAWPGCDDDHSPQLVTRSRMSRGYTFSTLTPEWW